MGTEIILGYGAEHLIGFEIEATATLDADYYLDERAALFARQLKMNCPPAYFWLMHTFRGEFVARLGEDAYCQRAHQAVMFDIGESRAAVS